MTVPKKPLAITDSLSEVYFEAAAEGRLLVQRCSSCERFQFYPRTLCAHCGSTEVAWHQASGRGTLHTFSVVYKTPNQEFAEDCPYVFAIVELEEGLRMTTRVIEADLDDLHCEMPVVARFPDPIDGGPTMPVFAPVEAEA